MPIDLYHVPASAPCRSTRLVAAALGVNLNLKLVDLMKGEQMKPEFLKMNPQHTVPTLDDNGFYLWESRAILGYLVDQYGKNDSLYPKEPKARALVNQRLYFDLGNLYQSFADYFYPMVFAGEAKDEKKLEKFEQTLGFLDKFLEGENYAAGKHLTIADIALATTVSNFELIPYDISKFKNIARWMQRVSKEIVKYDEINGEGVKAFKVLMDSLSKKK